MTPQDRRAAIVHAIEANDQVVMQSISRHPAFMSGLSPLQQQEHVNAWAERHTPAHAEHRRVLASVLEHVERGGKLLLSYSTGLSSSRIAETAEKRKLAADAALRAASSG